MATKVVANSQTGTMGNKALKRSRFEKMETAYGRIPAAAYTIGDTLNFNLPAKELIHAKFVFGTSLAGKVDPQTPNTATHAEALELLHGASLSSAIVWNCGAGAVAEDINYVIHYIRGTGKQGLGGSAAQQGIQIKLTPSAIA